METNKVLLIVGLILLLFFIFHNMSYTTIASVPYTTKSATVIYKPPTVTKVVVAPGHYNAYKAQYY